jgi:hemolysin activation/secretion protein
MGAEGSNFGQIRYGIPVGVDGWRVSAGVSALDYESLSSFSRTIAKGNAQTYGLYASYALERAATANKNIVLNYENKNYDNTTSNIPTSKYQINEVNLAINGTNYYARKYFTWSLTGTAGDLSIDNRNQAISDAAGAKTAGNSAKLALNASVTAPLPIDRTNITATLYAQLATKNLNSAEQIYLGGPYGVRAYPVSQGGGSQGAIATLEVNHVFRNQLQVGAFVDAGLVQQYVDTYTNWQGSTKASNVYALYSTGLLAKYNIGKMQVSGTLAFRLGDNPLYNQAGQQLNVDNEYNSMQGWIKASYFF